MSLLEECKKAEDDSKSSKPKTKKGKVKPAIATITLDMSS